MKEEARDKFDDGNLGLGGPPRLSLGARDEKDASPARTSSKFQEEL